MIKITGQGISVQPDLVSPFHVIVDGRRLARMEGAETPPAPAGPGQGAGAQQPPQPTPSNGDGFRQMFSGIDDATWGAVEPHLRDVQGHITQIEQANATVKPLLDAGLSTPEQAQTIATFIQNYNADPVTTWFQMAQQLSEAGVLPDDLDLDELQAILTGQPSPYEDQQPGVPAQQTPGAIPPEVIQKMESLEQAVTYLVNERQEERTQQEQRRQTALLQQAVANVKSQLKEAGAPEPTDAVIHGVILAHRGNVKSAVEELVGYRGSILEGLGNNNGGGPAPMPGGAPPTRQRPQRAPRSAFDEANRGAEQFLKRANEREAQGG